MSIYTVYFYSYKFGVPVMQDIEIEKAFHMGNVFFFFFFLLNVSFHLEFRKGHCSWCAMSQLAHLRLDALKGRMLGLSALLVIFSGILSLTYDQKN